MDSHESCNRGRLTAMAANTTKQTITKLPDVTVIVAFHKPEPAAAARQVGSLRRQTNVLVNIVAVLDGPETAADEELAKLLGQHSCQVVALQEQQGIRRAFAAGLAVALAEHAGPDRLFAYCDQDDVWHPEKLEKTCAALAASGAALVHCDATIIDGEGRLIAPSLHAYESRREPADLFGMLLLNTVTGMTALFTRRTAEVAVALCNGFSGKLLHDHITAIAAASLGRAEFVDEALIDYVQHGANQVGARPHAAWRSRALGFGHATAYRQTSALMFHERRAAAILLAGQGLLPSSLRAMFVTGRRSNVLALMLGYSHAITKLLLTGDGRRAMLALRMFDAGFFYLLTGGHRHAPPAVRGADKP